MMKREKLFAGYNKEEGKMAFIEVEIRTNRGKSTFSLCGTECYTTKWGKEEKKEHIESSLEWFSSDCILDKLKEYDCTWSELPEHLIGEFESNDSFGEHYYEVYKLVDSDGSEYQCDVSGCGQCDIRDFVAPLTPQITRLLEIWDEYHLKEITDELKQEVKDLIDTYELETEKLNDEKYGTDHLAQNIFKEICEYQFEVEGLY